MLSKNLLQKYNMFHKLAKYIKDSMVIGAIATSKHDEGIWWMTAKYNSYSITD